MKKRLGFMVWVITVMLLAIPAIAHDTQEVTINDGALYTVTSGVSLALAYTGLPAPTQMRLRNEGEEWPEWEPYNSTKQWVLSEKDGVKTVYVETRYWAKVGWSTLSDNSSITFDTTPPVMSAVRSVEPNANGWNNTDVSVTFQATDGLSGVASITGDTTVTTEGENQAVTGQAVDKAGNVATFAVAGINIDKTLPVITGKRSPAPNASGWNNTDVSVTFQATDGLSGVALITGDTTVTTEGENQSVTGQAVDKAGNVATFDVTGISIDKTLPVITGMRSPEANANGWNNTDISVTFQATDGLSGVASLTRDTTVMMERENQSVTGQVVDKAGNIATFDVTGISIDKTLPVITGMRSPAPNASGWNNTDISVTFQATDALSGVASLTGDTTVRMEGANQSVTGQAVDKAGNVATFAVAGINIDKTLPVITGMRSPKANANGWNNTDVSVTFQATDALSGVASLTGDTTVTTEGENQSVTGQVVDKAGNIATFAVAGISIDKTLPVITGMRSPEANANGWNNTDVSVIFQAVDALSGVALITGNATVRTEGDQSVTGQAMDNAGNIALFNVVVHLDRTPPNVSSLANPGADPMVWNNTDVSVSFEAADPISGVDGIEGTILLTEEGASQSITGTAVDKAGNLAAATLSNINIDKALPTLTVLVSGTDRKPIGEPLDVLTLLSSFVGVAIEDPVFAVGAQFFAGDGNIVADAVVTLMIQESLSSPEPGTAPYRMAWLTTCTYSFVSQQYYALFPTASLADGIYELWFTTNARQSVRACIVLGQAPGE